MSALESRCPTHRHPTHRHPTRRHPTRRHPAQRHRPGLSDLLRRVWRAAAAEAAALGRRLRRRRRFRNLLDLDDALLADIGVTGEEVRWAARLPLDANAALALRQRAARRREEEARWLQGRAARRRRG